MVSEKQLAANRLNAKLAGRPRLEATKLREALYREVEARADNLAKVIADKAEEGDIPAWREIVDRVMGKPQQSVDHTTAGKEIGVQVISYKPEHDDDNPAV